MVVLHLVTFSAVAILLLHSDVLAVDLQYMIGSFIRHFGNNSYTDRTLLDASALVPLLNAALPTVLYVHGFTGHVNTNSVLTVVNAYLNRGGYNVLALDYGEFVAANYITAVAHVKPVSEAAAEALDEMKNAGLNVRNLQIVGHSLGCQLASAIAKKVSFRVPRITGLDPAGPLFYFIEHHLQAGDADFVDIIHTDMGAYGNIHISGNVDFLPNCGVRAQPGCTLAITFTTKDICSHSRSWELYAESVTNEHAFLGIKCTGSLEFRNGLCDQNDKVYMGLTTPSTATGRYYLATGAASPRGLGPNGLKPDCNSACYLQI